MKRYLCVVMLTFCVFASILPLTQAGVISRDWKTPGDGLLTYDDVNRREWLDLTETQLFKFPGATPQEQHQGVLAELAPGGVFFGFTTAAADDVYSLARSAGIDTTTTVFSVNGDAANGLIALLGDPVLGAANNKYAGGFLTDGHLSSSLTIAAVPIGRSDAEAGIGFSNWLGSLNGVWLYRQVPEPSLLATSVLACVAFFSAVRRRFVAIY